MAYIVLKCLLTDSLMESITESHVGVKRLQVLQQLPSKETTVERVPMSFEQQDLYDELLAELANDVENESGKELKGASVMMSLRKAANHHLLHRRQFDDSKLKYMAELLVEVSCLCSNNDNYGGDADDDRKL